MTRPCDTCGAALDGQCYAQAEHQPVTLEFEADGVWINQVTIAKAGTALPQHAHAHDHMTCVTRGAVMVHREDMQPMEYVAPAVVKIPALVKHLFVTLTDEVIVLCVHRIDRTGAVEIAEEHRIVD